VKVKDKVKAKVKVFPLWPVSDRASGGR